MFLPGELERFPFFERDGYDFIKATAWSGSLDLLQTFSLSRELVSLSFALGKGIWWARAQLIFEAPTWKTIVKISISVEYPQNLSKDRAICTNANDVAKYGFKGIIIIIIFIT